VFDEKESWPMKKKRLRSKLIVWLICLLFILQSGCAGVPAKSSDDIIVIYCMAASEAEVKYYIDRFKDFYPDSDFEVRTFFDAREMDEVLVHALNVGIGPDIVIFNDETELDVLRMAKNGAFISLDGMIKADDAFNPEAYITSALAAGRADGRQYLLPLTFTIPLVMYDAASDLGFTPAPVISHADFMASVLDSIEASKDERYEGVLYVSNMTGNVQTNDLINPMLLASQILKLSEKNKVEGFDEEDVRQVVEWLKIYINECYAKSKDIMDARGRYAWAIAENMKYHYSYASFDIIRNIWWFNSCYSYADIDHFRVSAFREIEGGNVVAMLKSYGVIGNAAHPLAYQFLRIAMDTFLSPYAAHGNFASSANIANMEMMLASCTWGPSFRRLPDGSVFAEKPLDDALMDWIRQIFSSIDKVIIPNAKLDSIFRDSFMAYFENEKSYEDCANAFVQKLNLYLSE
jgi:hypothetical protein